MYSLLSLYLLTLKIKVFLPAKKKKKRLYSGITKNCNAGQASCSQNHSPVQQTKERDVIWKRRRRKLGGVAVNESPREKGRSPLQWWQFLTGWVAGSFTSCRRCNVHLFLLGLVTEDSFLVGVLLLGSVLAISDVEWYSTRAPPSGILTPFLLRFPFIDCYRPKYLIFRSNCKRYCVFHFSFCMFVVGMRLWPCWAA